MNIQNLWFEENKEKYHQYLSEIINFHNPKIAIQLHWRTNEFRLVKHDPSNCCRKKKIGPTHRVAAKTLERHPV